MAEFGRTKGEALLQAGYSPIVALSPTKVTESKGYKELLKEYGLTEGLITKALVSDIKAKPKRRFFELSLGSEILGMKKRAPEDDQRPIPVLNIFVQNVFGNNGNGKSSTDDEADQGSAGRNIGIENSIDHLIPDSPSPKRPTDDPDEHRS